MYVYLTTGILLLLTGVVTIFSWIRYLKNRRCEQASILSASQALTVIIIGAFYVYSTITMSHPLSHIDYNGTINTKQEVQYLLQDPSGEFMLKYNRSANARQINLDTCSLKNIFLQDSMLVYSFVHGLVTLINTASDCKSNYNAATDQKRKLSLRLLMLLIPPLCAGSYLAINSPENPTKAQQFMDTLTHNPANVSTATNQNQVTNIVQNVYRIIKQAKNDLTINIPTTLRNPNSATTTMCNRPNILQKVYMFVIFILGYFSVLLYTQTTYIDNKAYLKTKNLRTALFGFGTLWLPSILELFARVYLMESSPGLVTELLTAVGNFNHILTSTFSVLGMRNAAKSQNHVQPAE